MAPLLPKLRGHFAEFLNHSSPDRLGILYLTTCVGLGYGPCMHSLEAFLGSIGSPSSPQTATHHVSATWNTDLPMFRPTRLHQDNHRLAELPSCVTPSLDYYEIRSHAPQRRLHPKASPTCFGWLVSNASSWAHMLGYGNINPLSIDYACRPRLRSRLTLGGLAWPRNPWSSGGRVSHSAFATHACILTPTPSTTRLHGRFPGCRTLPYPSTRLHNLPKKKADLMCQ